MAATNEQAKPKGEAPSAGDVATAADAPVAPKAANDALEHSKGGRTTRSDATDLGVTMLPGDPNEPVGPEDAFGFGPTRGDYRQRLGDAAYNPHVSVPVPDADAGEPNVVLVPQAQLAQAIAEVPREKGGTQAPDAYVVAATKAR